MFTSEQVQELSLIPETSFRFQATVDSLVSFYKWVRQEWSKDAIAEHRQKYELDCRSTIGKVRFAWYAAKELSQNCLPLFQSEPEEAQEPETTQTDSDIKTVRVLSQAIALLNPVPPTNGLENSPPYKLMGKPIYFDELVRNYRVLATKFHPDLNPSPEAQTRFQIVNEVYETLKGNWFTKYSPLIPKADIGKENIRRAFEKKFSFPPESFWG